MYCRVTLSTIFRPRYRDYATQTQTQQHHAVVSTFDLFSIGIGPSSSHTVGPMRAARVWMKDLNERGIVSQIEKVRVDLYGSLALTGQGHGTINACLLGIEGEAPETINTKTIVQRGDRIRNDQIININGTKKIKFEYAKDMLLHMTTSLTGHPNGMRFSGFNEKGDVVATAVYYSIGGGFIVNAQDNVDHGQNIYYKDRRTDHVEAVSKEIETAANLATNPSNDRSEGKAFAATADEPAPTQVKSQDAVDAALPFTNAEDLLQLCLSQNKTIAQVVYQNELQWRTADDIKQRLLAIWKVMDDSITNGINGYQDQSILPGGLNVRRRAPGLYKKLISAIEECNLEDDNGIDYSKQRPGVVVLDQLSVYAIAVNEENAAGGRVVTAPTNGAAGVLPAVLKYYLEFLYKDATPQMKDEAVMSYLLTCAAIGMLYKRGASISAAEMGCQGEVGVASSMAAAGLAALMGGTIQQIENAAEIGMEHNLGLTCDPIGGLVQIPCIERNALGAVKSVTAAQLSMNGDGVHRVTLDQVIATMKQTGIDMMSKYKETSTGGLAVNVPMC